jgi:hypothetical protein
MRPVEAGFFGVVLGVYFQKYPNRQKYPQMPLTDTACKKATCPPDKPRVRLTDERGLYLEVTPKGKYFRLKYRFDDREKLLALGVYRTPALCRRERRATRRARPLQPGKTLAPCGARQSKPAHPTRQTRSRQWRGCGGSTGATAAASATRATHGGAWRPMCSRPSVICRCAASPQSTSRRWQRP